MTRTLHYRTEYTCCRLPKDCGRLDTQTGCRYAYLTISPLPTLSISHLISLFGIAGGSYPRHGQDDVPMGLCRGRSRWVPMGCIVYVDCALCIYYVYVMIV